MPAVPRLYVLQTEAEAIGNRFVKHELGTGVIDAEGRRVRPVLLDGEEKTLAVARDVSDGDLNESLRAEILRVLEAADEIGFRVGSIQGMRHDAESTSQVQVHGVALGSVMMAQAVALIDMWAWDVPEIHREHYPAKENEHHAFSTVFATDCGVMLKVFTAYSADLGADVDDTTGGAP